MRGQRRHQRKLCPTHGAKCSQFVVFHTPGRECAHACKGCCPSCMSPRVFRRFVARTLMPTATQKSSRAAMTSWVTQ